MPTAQQLAGAVDPQQRRSGRWRMLAVLAVCAAPVIASYFTYYVIRPEGRSVYGELIEPQRPMPAGLAATDINGQRVDVASLQHQWLLVATGGGACDARCEQNLYLQRQMRESLGREKERVDRVWLVTDGQPVAERLRPALQGATVLQVPQAELARWLAPAAGQNLGDHLYVVDPQGHWMMRFPAGLDAAGAARAKRDVERLLRASSSWDQPGREPR